MASAAATALLMTSGPAVGPAVGPVGPAGWSNSYLSHICSVTLFIVVYEKSWRKKSRCLVCGGTSSNGNELLCKCDLTEPI